MSAEFSPDDDAADRVFFSRRRAARHIDISESKLDDLIASGELRAYRLGRSVRVKREDLEALLTPKEARV